MSDEDAAQTAQHLESCGACQGFLQNLAEPAYVARLRKHGTVADSAANEGDGVSSKWSNAEQELISQIEARTEYDVVRTLGKGGMSSVYLVVDRRTREKMALKVLLSEHAAKPEYLERTRREVEVLRVLRHPTIVRYIGSRQITDALLVLLMEYIEGDSLGELLRRQGPLPFWRACRYIIEALSGLAYLESLKMVHRDLKPDNLVVSFRGRLKIVDFGLVRDHGMQSVSRATPAGITLGTPAYMSPEQAVDPSQVDVRSDIYSMGCVLYELLTGRPPFTGRGYEELLRAHQVSVPVPPRRLYPEIPARLSRTVLQMLEKKPERRFQSAHATILALSPFEKPTERLSIVRGRVGRIAVFIAACVIGGAVYVAIEVGRGGGSARRPIAEDPGRGIAVMHEGRLDVEGRKGPYARWFGDGRWEEVVIDVDVCLLQGKEGPRIYFHSASLESGRRLEMASEKEQGLAVYAQGFGEKSRRLESCRFKMEVAHWYHVRLDVCKDKVESWVDGERLLSVTLPSIGGRGRIGLGAAAGCRCGFGSLVVRGHDGELLMRGFLGI